MALHGNRDRVVTTNRSVILDTLCHTDSLSRAQIAELTGIPLPTVHRLCTQLRKEGIIQESAKNRDGRGRPVRLLHLNPSFHAVLVVNVRGTAIDGAVVSLNDRILHEEHMPQPPEDDKGGTGSRIRAITAMARLLDRWAADRSIPCTGIGVAVPGIVQNNGMVTAASELGWNEVPLGDILRTAGKGPVLIENNANAYAYGEVLAGAGKNHNPVVGYTIRHFGVGAGIVVDGCILRGSHGMAGEMGYTLTSRESLDKYYTYGGDLEWQISQISAVEDQPSKRSEETLIDLISLSIGDICLVADPEIIVLDIAPTLPGQRIREGIRRRLIGRIPHMPDLAATQLGRKAPLIGVGELISQQVRTAAFNV